MRYSHLVPELSDLINIFDDIGAADYVRYHQTDIQDLLIKVRKHIINLEKNQIEPSNQDKELKEQVQAEIQKKLAKLKVTTS